MTTITTPRHLRLSGALLVLLSAAAPAWALQNSPPLVITSANTVIDGKRISNASGHCIDVRGAKNVVIRNSVIGPCAGNGIQILNAEGVTIEGNSIEKVSSGVYAVNSKRIVVQKNRFLNVMGPFPRGQYVQFNNVQGGGNRINDNEGESRLGESYPEDLINLYKSSGTASDRIQVIGNRFKGGGPSKSGGGIMTGDNDGSHILVKDNVLVDPGQYGIAIAGGQNITLTNNRIYGKQQSFTNVGLYVWRQKNTSGCGNHTVSNNQVRYTNKDGKLNSVWNAGNCGTLAGWSSNDWNAPLSDAIYRGLGVASLLTPGATKPTPTPPPTTTPPPTNTPRIDRVTLVDTDTGTSLQVLQDGGSYPLLDDAVAIRADVTGTPGYVWLELAGPLNHVQVEKLSPYTLFGDSPDAYYGRVLPAGAYTLTVTLKTDAGANLAAPKVVRFRLTETVKPVQPGRYALQAAHSGKCLDVAGVSTASGANLQQWACSYRPNQLFDLVSLSDGSYALRPLHSGAALDLYKGQTANGTNIQQWAWYASTPNQRWSVLTEDDHVTIRPRSAPNSCMDVSGRSQNNGANVHLWHCHGGTNQQWRLIPAGTP